jgi:hypothetical protein
MSSTEHKSRQKSQIDRRRGQQVGFLAWLFNWKVELPVWVAAMPVLRIFEPSRVPGRADSLITPGADRINR